MRSAPERTLSEVIGDYRRTQLVEVASRLFAERRSDGVSMEEIAKQAGMSRSTAYVHFPSRESLLDACVRRATTDVAVRMACVGRAEPDARRRFTLLVGELLQHADESRELYRFAAYATSPDAIPGVDGNLPLIGPDSEGLLADALADCLGRSATVQEFSLVRSQVHGAMVIRAACRLRSSPSCEAVAITEFLLRGLATPYPEHIAGGPPATR